MIEAEKKYSSINENLKEIQLKLTDLKKIKQEMKLLLKELKIEKKIYFIQLKMNLNIENESSILPQSDLNDLEIENFPSIEEQTEKIEKTKKQERVSWICKS